jgi:hypothetical protein
MKAYDVEDLGVAVKFLDVKFEYETARGYSMSERSMILNLIEQFGRMPSILECQQLKLSFLLKRSISCQLKILVPHIGWRNFVDRHTQDRVSVFQCI